MRRAGAPAGRLLEIPALASAALRTQGLADFTIVPEYEILYQAARPGAGAKTRTIRRRSVFLFVPLWFLIALIESWTQQGQSDETKLAAAIVLLAALVGFAVSLALVSRSIAHPTPPPAITKEGVLLYRWKPFGPPSLVHHRFEGQRTVKGYRAGKDTVIEMHAPHGKSTKIALFDPEGRALKFVRETVLTSGP